MLFENLKKKELFTENERFIVNYILNHQEDVLEMSIYKLAEITNSSTSTIVRMCRKCEVSGFKEFKIYLAREIERNLEEVSGIDANMPFLPEDTDLIISQKIACLTKETIESTQKLLTTKKLNETIKLITKANRIYGIGVSNSFIRLLDFQCKMVKIKKYVELIHFQSEQYHLAQTASTGDVAIIVSYSGETAEIVNDARIFQRRGAKVIAITGNIESSLAKCSEIILRLPNNEESNYKVSNFSSHLAIEYVLNVIYSCIFNRNFIKNYECQNHTPTTRLYF